MLRQQIPGCVRLTDGERTTLAEMGKKLGKQALEEVATIVTPNTMLAWHRKLRAQKFNGAQQRKAPGRPPVVLIPSSRKHPASQGPLRGREWLGGLLKYYYREAA